MHPEPGTRHMPGSRWYHHRRGLTRQPRGAFHTPCPQSRRQRVRPGPVRAGGSGRGLRNMGEQRPGACLLRLAAVGAAPAVYAVWVRPQLLAWGATHEEASGAYPGDELISDPAHCSTMATTLPAPPERVWPWLVQMGYDRAGWYSWDKLDHGGKPSADRIVPQWQNLHEGQRLNSMAHGRDQMTVAVLEPGRTMVLRSLYQVPSFRTVEPRPARIHLARLQLARQPALGPVALHHADPPVPQPARPGRRASVTGAGAAVGAHKSRRSP